MLGLFSPRPPIDLREKVWIERRLGWLIEQFGVARCRSVETVLPTGEHFPLDFQPDEASVRRVLEIVCDHLQIPPQRFQLEFFEKNPADGDAAATYQMLDDRHSLIRVRSDHLDDLERLVAVLAHEACHELLLRPQRIAEDEPDGELLTDLTVVFHGLGVFGANVAVKQQNLRAGDWEAWELQRLGYLPARMSGYAMAVQGWLNGMTSPPPWIEFLTADGAVALKRGLKYLVRTGDCLLQPESIGRPRNSTSAATIADGLKAASPTRRLDAMHQLRQQPADAGAVAADLESNLVHRNPVLAAEAAETIAETRAAVNTEPLLSGLSHGDAEVRRGCVRALAALRAPLGDGNGASLQTLYESLLEDPERRVALAAAEALASHGPAAADSAPQIVDRLLLECRDCQFQAIDRLLASLSPIVGDIAAYLDQHAPDIDPDLREVIDSAR